MPDKEILESRLFEIGAMIRVSDAVKDNAFPPGSLGFVSFIKGIDESYQNVAKTVAVMIRKGKTGKPRILNATLCTPIFNLDDKNFQKLMPESGKKKYYVHMERHKPRATDVLALSDLEFLGYAVAIARHIRHMSDQCRHKKWPEDKGHPINVVRRMPDHFEEDPEGYLDKFANEEFRINFVEEARRMSSALVRVQIQLEATRADTEIYAAEFLLFTNKGEFIPKDAEDKTNEYEFTKDNAMLKRTIEHCQKRRKVISGLYDKKKKKS